MYSAGSSLRPEMSEFAPQNINVTLSIVIVSWNVRDLLEQCLHSVARQKGSPQLEAIVVDSASSDGTVAMVSQKFPWVRLLAQDENVGFPRGNNIGLRAARGEYLLLLNPDTIVQDGALGRMVEYMETELRTGALGPRLRYPDGAIQPSRRRFPTLMTAFFESTWLEPWAPPPILRRYRALDLPEDAIAEVDWVMGAALMVRRAVVEQVGLLDEAYFMYSEELDWCRRIKEAGWRVVYFPEAEIIHYEGKSSEQAVTARHINFQRAKLRYFRKFHGRFFSGLLRTFLLLNYGWQLALEVAKGLLGHKRALRRQRVAAYWQVIRSGLRPAGY